MSCCHFGYTASMLCANCAQSPAPTLPLNEITLNCSISGRRSSNEVKKDRFGDQLWGTDSESAGKQERRAASGQPPEFQFYREPVLCRVFAGSLLLALGFV